MLCLLRNIHFHKGYVNTSLTDGHLVLGECPCLVGADDRGTSQCLHCLQFTDQTVLGLHALGSQCEAYLEHKEGGGREGGREGREGGREGS